MIFQHTARRNAADPETKLSWLSLTSRDSDKDGPHVYLLNTYVFPQLPVAN